jgi:hypothetical protein
VKIRIFISLVLISILLAGCDSTDVEKIDTVTVTGYAGEPYEVELSRDVTLPINLSDAIFIMEECYEPYDSSLGEPELIDENWVFYWCPEYPDWEIKVNRNNGDVMITLFG